LHPANPPILRPFANYTSFKIPRHSYCQIYPCRPRTDFVIFSYVQFAPVAYIVKLQIELIMADLISKVVRSGSAERVDDWYSSGNHTSNRTRPNGRSGAGPAMPQTGGFFAHSVRMNTNISGGRVDGVRDEDKAAGIVKTVTTVVKSDSSEDSGEEYQVNGKRLTGDFTAHKSGHTDSSA
jgi:hypothetical protein